MGTAIPVETEKSVRERLCVSLSQGQREDREREDGKDKLDCMPD